jgi:aspartate racemase
MENKHIGIIGGVGPASTVLYYQQIIKGFQEKSGSQHVPEIMIYSLDLAEINDFFSQEDFKSLADRLVGIINGMSEMGCDFALFACNAMHQVFNDVASKVSIPMINLIEAVKGEILERKFNKVGLLGTTFVMQTGIYRDGLAAAGVGCLVPDESEQDWIMAAINEDLQKSEIPPATIDRLKNYIIRMDEQGSEGVILGCIDLPVAVNQNNSPLPVFDSTEIHVRAIIDFALK